MKDMEETLAHLFESLSLSTSSTPSNQPSIPIHLKTIIIKDGTHLFVTIQSNPPYTHYQPNHPFYALALTSTDGFECQMETIRLCIKDNPLHRRLLECLHQLNETDPRRSTLIKILYSVSR
jgi:hypothetical protein